MRLDRVDLNLFVVFEAIYVEGSLSRAAEVLNITQPAVSNALRRLRESLGDPLFIRSGNGMRPTVVADNLVSRVREALRLLRTSIDGQMEFDPGSTERTFRIAMGDLASALLLPGLLNRLQQSAPQIAIRSVVVPRLQVPVELANNSIDLAIEPPLLSNRQMNSRLLLEDEHVCLLREGHPKAGQPLSLQTYLGLEHLHLSSRRRGSGLVDLALKGLGKKRRISLRAQHYLLAPLIVAKTDLALTLPRSLADCLGLAGLPLPFDVEPLRHHLFWHQDSDEDPANLWLRKLIFAEFEALAF